MWTLANFEFLGLTVGSLPADHHAVIGAINLCMPRSKTLVESRRDNLGKGTLEFWTTKERDVTPV